MKVVSIVGARPQFVKAAAVSRRLRERHTEFLVHTGQHYDYEMSGIFFDGLDLPAPDINLEAGSGSHGQQTGTMLASIEGVLQRERPDCVLVYGDTNSTLAGALAASKLHIPVVHVEAGLRSFNRAMPEEINRVVADRLSTQLFCPSDTAVRNLAAEGIADHVHMVGDVMLDVLQAAQPRADCQRPALLARFGLEHGRFVFATIHRAENTDDVHRFLDILSAVNSLEEPMLFPAHPRVRRLLDQHGSALGSHVRVIEPLGYVETVALIKAARMVLTDSGGLQKEAYWLGAPCVTLRDETEWVETVAAGWNRLVGSDPDRILDAVRSFVPPAAHPALYGDGLASSKCVELLD